MTARTKSLFHFTRSLENLLLILKNGFWPRYCLEDITWITGDPQFFAMPMVCFCDIPISRLGQHTNFYGSYGIGLARDWGVEKQLNPVFYLSSHSSAREHLLGMMCNPHPKRPEAKTNAMIVLSNCKPLVGVMEIAGKKLQKDFYAECEWRYVPIARHGSKYAFLNEVDFRKKSVLEAANNERRAKDMLVFKPKDVRYILVRSLNDIPKLVNFIQTELGHFPHDDLKLLVTRIVALEEIEADI